MNVWVDLINSLSFFQTLVSDPTHLDHPRQHLPPRVEVQRVCQKRQQICHELKFVNIFYDPNLSGSKFNNFLSINLKMHLSRPLEALDQFRDQF